MTLIELKDKIAEALAVEPVTISLHGTLLRPFMSALPPVFRSPSVENGYSDPDGKLVSHPSQARRLKLRIKMATAVTTTPYA